MPPKQETHTERISALEGQIGGFATAIEELREATAKSEKSILDASTKAEERHAQLMAMFQQQTKMVADQEKNKAKEVESV